MLVNELRCSEGATPWEGMEALFPLPHALPYTYIFLFIHIFYYTLYNKLASVSIFFPEFCELL